MVTHFVAQKLQATGLGYYRKEFTRKNSGWFMSILLYTLGGQLHYHILIPIYIISENNSSLVDLQ